MITGEVKISQGAAGGRGEVCYQVRVASLLVKFVLTKKDAVNSFVGEFAASVIFVD